MVSGTNQITNPDLSVVILTYNVREMVLDCVESVMQASDGLRVEIIVSDNCSTDGTVEAVRERYPDVFMVENTENLGYAAGNNRGIEVSRGRHVLILNPDTVVDKDALRFTLEYAESHPECGVVGCRVLNPDGSVQQSWFAKWSLFQALWIGLGLQSVAPMVRIDGRRKFTREPPDRAVQVDRLLGCFLWIRRDVIDRVGMFDEDFFLYGEEEDLCQRVRDAGLEVHYYPGVDTVHYGGQSTKHVKEWARIEANVSKVLWMKKHRGAAETLVFRIIWSFFLIIRVLFRLPLGLINRYHRSIMNAEIRSVRRIWVV